MASLVSEKLDFYENLINISRIDLEYSLNILNKAEIKKVGFVLAKKVLEIERSLEILLNNIDICAVAFEVVLDKAKKHCFDKKIKKCLYEVEIYANFIDTNFICNNQKTLERILNYAQTYDLEDAILKIARG